MKLKDRKSGESNLWRMLHEMRTPLTTINGLLEGMQYNAIPENQKEKAIAYAK